MKMPKHESLSGCNIIINDVAAVTGILPTENITGVTNGFCRKDHFRMTDVSIS